jgi:CxxC motif-containing protein (DUF1111 family)
MSSVNGVRPRSVSRPALLAAVALSSSLALGACNGETAHHPQTVGGAGSTGSVDPTGTAGVTTTPTGTAGGTVDTVPMGTAGSTMMTEMPPPFMPPDGPPVLPTTTCGGAGLPSTFVAICSGCHTASGAANLRYPDLFAFKGTADALKAKVRMGGNGMAAYPASVVADADLDAIFTFFTTKTRSTLDATSLGSVKPLFTATDAVNPPIVFKRDDGVIVTRGAGRVRGRHEGPLDTNQPFMEFVQNYFVDRTYGWIVEDYTAIGQSKIVTTYLPNGPENGGTNFRAFKNYGNGDVFSTNGGMTIGVPMPNLSMGGTDMAPGYKTTISSYMSTQQHIMTTNTRTNAPIASGELFEFEFGLFFEGTIKPAGSRHAYYTDTFRYQVGKGGVTANNPDKYTGAKGILGPVPAAQSGGDTTNVWPYYMQETQFGQMALNVQHENVQHLVEGRRLFHTSFVDGAHSEVAVQNPPFMEQAGKAGPLGQNVSCDSCHLNNGAGELMKAGLDKSSMAIKLYNAGALGVQLQPQEGSAMVMGATTKTVMLGDGTSVTLSKPTIAVMAKDGTQPAFSARIARKVIGMGLLEAIDERTILSRADSGDCDKNGISGRVNFIKDPVSGALRVGRFGWKAEKVSVKHQIAEAASEDMGVGTSMFPENGKAELADADLAAIETYMRLVSVPGQRNYGDPVQVRGEQIFKTIGCSNCHATDVVTGPNHPFTELRNQAIKPYSDLLLHDMGPDLADNSAVAAPTSDSSPASASEWRTPPLWGTGLLMVVNGKVGLLHDGRANGVQEAILWHGGEATKAQAAFVALPTADRTALVAFVNSL